MKSGLVLEAATTVLCCNESKGISLGGKYCKYKGGGGGAERNYKEGVKEEGEKEEGEKGKGRRGKAEKKEKGSLSIRKRTVV